MIRYLKHQQIDKAAWDQTMARAVNRKVYAFSWYLDTVSPGWEALVLDDYSVVFPLTIGRKWGISYLFQPYFTQQLGIFSTSELTKETVDRFIHAIPAHFRLANIHLNERNGFFPGSENPTFRLNHVLDMKTGYERINAGYARNTGRNLKKAASAGLSFHPVSNSDEVVELFRRNFGTKEGKLQERHYNIMHSLIRQGMLSGTGVMHGVSGADGVLQAAAFFLTDHSTVYFLFAASSTRARETGAMFLLIDRFIRQHAALVHILDFEGGNDPQLGRFYKGFGASEVRYPVFTLNRLPWYINLGYTFLRNRH